MLTDRGDLGLVLACRDDIPDRLPQQRARQRRDVRYRALRRIGLVLADDRKSLLAPVVANDRHGASELDGGAPGAPVTQVTPGLRQGLPVTRSLGFAMAAVCVVQRGHDQLQPVARDMVRMLRYGPIRQVLDVMVFVHKGSAHAGNMGIRPSFLMPGQRQTETVTEVKRSCMFPRKRLNRWPSLAFFRSKMRGPPGLRYQRRSLYVMSGESGDLWQHSIPAVEQRRSSITFRTMKGR